MRSGDVVAGRYQLEESVGAGGMGEVWRATDLELRRVVALKLATTGDGEVTRREARIGAGLHHPNVISVFDIVVDGDRCRATARPRRRTCTHSAWHCRPRPRDGRTSASRAS